MKLAYDGWHKIAEIEAEIKGEKVLREKLILKSAVAAIITDTAGNIGLVKQYRPIIGKTVYEIPAGVMDKEGLTAEETLIEEIKEECEIDNILTICPLRPYYMVAGSSDATMQLFRVIVDPQPAFKEVADVEVESVHFVKPSKMYQMIQDGEIVCNKTIMAFYILNSEALGSTGPMML